MLSRYVELNHTEKLRFLEELSAEEKHLLRLEYIKQYEVIQELCKLVESQDRTNEFYNCIKGAILAGEKALKRIRKDPHSISLYLVRSDPLDYLK